MLSPAAILAFASEMLFFSDDSIDIQWGVAVFIGLPSVLQAFILRTNRLLTYSPPVLTNTLLLPGASKSISNMRLDVQELSLRRCGHR